MSEQNDGGLEPATEPELLGEQSDLLAELQDLHQQAKEAHWLDLAVPGYKDLLWARFRPFPVEKTEAKIAEMRRVARQGGPVVLNSSIDTLIDACEQLMLLPKKFNGDIGPLGENLIPIDEAAVPPIGFDSRIEPLFKLSNPSKTARGVVLALFPTEQGITAMNVRVSQWMQDVTRETNEDLLGE